MCYQFSLRPQLWYESEKSIVPFARFCLDDSFSDEKAQLYVVEVTNKPVQNSSGVLEAKVSDSSSYASVWNSN